MKWEYEAWFKAKKNKSFFSSSEKCAQCTAHQLKSQNHCLRCEMITNSFRQLSPMNAKVDFMDSFSANILLHSKVILPTTAYALIYQNRFSYFQHKSRHHFVAHRRYSAHRRYCFSLLLRKKWLNSNVCRLHANTYHRNSYIHSRRLPIVPTSTHTLPVSLWRRTVADAMFNHIFLAQSIKIKSIFMIVSSLQ